MGDSPKPRPLRFPYTFTAQLIQFPYKHYWNKSWLIKYWIIASIIAAPLFLKLERMSYSEENVKTWHEKRKKMYGCN